MYCPYFQAASACPPGFSRPSRLGDTVNIDPRLVCHHRVSGSNFLRFRSEISDNYFPEFPEFPEFSTLPVDRPTIRKSRNVDRRFGVKCKRVQITILHHFGSSMERTTAKVLLDQPLSARSASISCPGVLQLAASAAMFPRRISALSKYQIFKNLQTDLSA